MFGTYSSLNSLNFFKGPDKQHVYKKISLKKHSLVNSILTSCHMILFICLFIPVFKLVS